MSLWHFADSLLSLKESRYNNRSRDLSLITENYNFYVYSLLEWITRSSKGKLKAYVLRRIEVFQHSLMRYRWYKQPMPGEDARNSWWGDPFIQEAVERRRR